MYFFLCDRQFDSTKPLTSSVDLNWEDLSKKVN